MTKPYPATQFEFAGNTTHSELAKSMLRRRTTSRHIYKIAIFGCTGRTGNIFVREALENNHTIICFVRNKQKLLKQINTYDKPVKEKAGKYLTLIECDIFNQKELLDGLRNVDVVVSLLNFHRRNNKGWYIDHYTRWIKVIVDSMQTANVENIMALLPWYTGDRGKSISNKGISGSFFKFMLKYVKGHLLVDMDNAMKVLQSNSDNITWTTLHVPALRRGPRLDKSIQSDVGDRIQSVIDEFPFYKTKYHTMRFADAARHILDIVENKIIVQHNTQVALSYKFGEHTGE